MLQLKKEEKSKCCAHEIPASPLLKPEVPACQLNSFAFPLIVRYNYVFERMVDVRYFFDTEFVEDENRLEMISIGIVSEDGRELYRESSKIDYKSLPDWHKKNIVPSLAMHTDTPEDIREYILEFIGEDDEPEFWAYFGAYDWVLFCKLFGRMIDLPKDWPMFVRDIQIVRTQLGGVRLLPHTGTVHNALDDARWTKECFDYLHEIASLGACSEMLFR